MNMADDKSFEMTVVEERPVQEANLEHQMDRDSANRSEPKGFLDV